MTRQDSADFYLWRLRLLDHRLNLLGDTQLIEQLTRLANSYKIQHHKNERFMIKSLSTPHSVDSIRLRLQRLMFMEKKLWKFLDQPASDQSKVRGIKSEFGRKRLEHFYSGGLVEDAIRRLDELFTQKESQCVVIGGESGCGKTSLSLEYAYMRHDQYLVRFVSSTRLEGELDWWAKCFGIQAENDLNCRVKARINEYAAKNGTRILFILDNCESKDLVDMLCLDLDTKLVKILVTTGANLNGSRSQAWVILVFLYIKCTKFRTSTLVANQIFFTVIL